MKPQDSKPVAPQPQAHPPRAEDQEPLRLTSDQLHLARTVARSAHTDLAACLQCRTCSSGCPFLGPMDYGPHGVMRLVHLGQRETVLGCNTIWICVGCHTCSAACPMAIDIAGVMDALKHMALASGVAPAEPRVLAFHREVLGAIEQYGRTHKLQVMLRYKATQGEWFRDVDLGLKMLAKRKLHLLPSRIANPKELKPLFGKPWRQS